MIICIPSYGRHTTIRQKTLATLERGGITRDQVYIFVVNEERRDYELACPGYRIIVGKKGLINQRKFIRSIFLKGEFLVMMDDDIEDIYEPGADGKSKISVSNLKMLFGRMCFQMIAQNIPICGVYPVDNPKFARGNSEISTDFRYIVGALYIIRNDIDIDLEPNVADSVEDKQRSIMYYMKYNGVLRFNWVCIKTKYFAPGGIQSISPDRKEKHAEYCKMLVDIYPDFLRLKTKRSGLVDCGFKKIKPADHELPEGFIWQLHAPQIHVSI